MVVCDTAKKAIHLLSLAEKIPYVKHIIIMNNEDDLTVLKAKAGDNIKIVTFNDMLVLLFFNLISRVVLSISNTPLY